MKSIQYGDMPQADAMLAERRWAGEEEEEDVNMSISLPSISSRADAVMYIFNDHPYPSISGFLAPEPYTSVTPAAMMLPVFTLGTCSTPRQYRYQYWYHLYRSLRRPLYRSRHHLNRPLASSSFFGAVGCRRLIRPT